MSAPRHENAPRTTAPTVTGAPARRDDADWDAALARRLRGAGLAAPAVLWLASLRPLWFLGGQALRLAEPFWDALRDDAGASRLADLLEDPARCERLLARLAAPQDGEGPA